MSTPKDRAAIAKDLLDRHPAGADCVETETFVQLLSDLMHHAARECWDFEALLSQARQTHRDELIEHAFFR